MKLMLIAIGTRGDIEPFLAAGELLIKAGHDVIGVFPDQYGSLAKESGIRFLPLDKGFIEMIEGEIGQRALGGNLNAFQKFKAYYKLYKTAKTVNHRVFTEQFDYIKAENPDRIIHSIKATVPVHWHHMTSKPILMLSPIPCITHPIKGKASIAFRGRNLGKTLNKWSYKFTRYTAIKYLRGYLKKLGEVDPGQKALEKSLLAEPALFTVSPSFFNLEDQPSLVHFLGYLERNKEKHWQPSEELLDFVKKNKRFLFVTFGSMSNPEPERKTAIILEVLSKLQIPAIINIAGGGLREPKDYDHAYYQFVK
ncbi:MAG TPA: glycosyltransferase, partial [Roseivirga sp.]